MEVKSGADVVVELLVVVGTATAPIPAPPLTLGKLDEKVAVGRMDEIPAAEDPDCMLDMLEYEPKEGKPDGILDMPEKEPTDGRVNGRRDMLGTDLIEPGLEVLDCRADIEKELANPLMEAKKLCEKELPPIADGVGKPENDPTSVGEADEVAAAERETVGNRENDPLRLDEPCCAPMPALPEGRIAEIEEPNEDALTEAEGRVNDSGTSVEKAEKLATEDGTLGRRIELPYEEVDGTKMELKASTELDGSVAEMDPKLTVPNWLLVACNVDKVDNDAASRDEVEDDVRASREDEEAAKELKELDDDDGTSREDEEAAKEPNELDELSVTESGTDELEKSSVVDEACEKDEPNALDDMETSTTIGLGLGLRREKDPISERDEEVAEEELRDDETLSVDPEDAPEDVYEEDVEMVGNDELAEVVTSSVDVVEVGTADDEVLSDGELDELDELETSDVKIIEEEEEEEDEDEEEDEEELEVAESEEDEDEDELELAELDSVEVVVKATSVTNCRLRISMFRT